MSRSNSRARLSFTPFSASSHNRAGFTLLEVMIALAIIAISLTSLFGSQSRSLSLAAEAKFNTAAAFLAQEKLAEYEAGLAPWVSDEGDFGDAFPGFAWKSEVQDADLGNVGDFGNLEPPLQRVDLTISWQEGQFSSTVSYFGREKEQQ